MNLYNKEITNLKKKGYCVIKKFINLHLIEDFRENIEKFYLHDVISSERLHISGTKIQKYISFSNEFVKKIFLKKKIVEDLEILTNKKIYFRRMPFFKINNLPSKDISFQWHRDLEKPQYAVMLYLSNVNENTPRTQILPSFLNLGKYLDPRNSKLGKLEAKISNYFNKPIDLFGDKGDLIIINNGYFLHRGINPDCKIEKFKPREILMCSLSTKISKAISENEKEKYKSKPNQFSEISDTVKSALKYVLN